MVSLACTAREARTRPAELRRDGGPHGRGLDCILRSNEEVGQHFLTFSEQHSQRRTCSTTARYLLLAMFDAAGIENVLFVLVLT